jgi:AcrR family transcriptional regulator
VASKVANGNFTGRLASFYLKSADISLIMNLYRAASFMIQPTTKTPTEKAPNARGARSIGRILTAATDIFGKVGFQASSMNAVARAAGVSKGLLHYHFKSKEHLLFEAQQATFKQIHTRFQERFERGETGMETALEGIDALWESLCEMRSWAPFFVETMNLASHSNGFSRHVDEFYSESTRLLQRGIENVFQHHTDDLALPPDRLAMLIRTAIHGLVVELAYARDAKDVQRVATAYQDFRGLFARSVLAGPLFTEEKS